MQAIFTLSMFTVPSALEACPAPSCLPFARSSWQSPRVQQSEAVSSHPPTSLATLHTTAREGTIKHLIIVTI